MDLLSKLETLVDLVDGKTTRSTIGYIERVTASESPYNASFVWTVDYWIDELFTTTEHKSFPSPQFKVSQSSWQLKLYPNGTKKEFEDSVCIRLRMEDTEYQSLFVKFDIKCIQTGHDFQMLQLFEADIEYGVDRLIRLEYLKKFNLKQLSFMVNIDIIRVKSE